MYDCLNLIEWIDFDFNIRTKWLPGLCCLNNGLENDNGVFAIKR